eukprot:10052992-Lingulodinium_polyedra.AAC.1
MQACDRSFNWPSAKDRVFKCTACKWLAASLMLLTCTSVLRKSTCSEDAELEYLPDLRYSSQRARDWPTTSHSAAVHA